MPARLSSELERIVLDRIAKNEAFVNLARDRAARLAAELRGTGKAAVE